MLRKLLFILSLFCFISNAQTSDDFVFEITGWSNFSIDFALTATGNVTIDWGNGQSNSYSNPSRYVSNRYFAPGPYTVIITGDIDHIRFDTDDYYVMNVTQWGASQWQSMSEMFKDSNQPSITASLPPDLSQVSSTSSMFENAGNLNSNSLNISNWDVSSVNDMSRMFANAQEFNVDISGWDLSGVTDMSEMFSGAESFNSDISSWDVSNVVDMSGLFHGAASFSSDLSSWDVSSVTNMHAMFSYCTIFNSDLSNWDVSNVSIMSEMFLLATNFNSNLSSWNVSNVINMSKMFEVATNFNSDISSWNVSNVVDMSGMFGEAGSFNADISSWDVSSVNNLSRMFRRAFSFNSDISSWDVSNVTTMRSMFLHATNFNSDLSSWNVSNVLNMEDMFYLAVNFNSDISSWDVSNVTSMWGMFNGATNFNSDISSWDVSNVTHMPSMFRNAVHFNSDLSSWDVSSVIDMTAMFEGARNFNSNLSAWDVSNVGTMHFMFYNSTNFNSDISSWDVSNVTSMWGMFNGATNFNSDISSWDVSNVTTMRSMFYGATNFNQDLTFWDFSGLSYRFGNTPLFETFDLSGLDTVNYDKLLAGLVNSNIRSLDLGVQGLKYCDTFSRNILTQRNWRISGDSQSQNCPNNELNGTIIYDLDNNGCNASDLLVPNTAVEISDGSNNIIVYSNDRGIYETNLPDGIYTITPVINNLLFNVSPTAPRVTLSNETTVSQDFCLTAVSPVDDLEVSLSPTAQARPGFDTSYILVYKNNGNTQLSGNLSLSYEEGFMDFLVATPAAVSSTSGSLNWDFVDLDPFETREIEFSMNLNPSTDPTFPLNSNDVLSYNATINPATNDPTPQDNVFDLLQTVVNSYDPNDKTCLQGNQITPDKVGEYVHYRIRFENEGTASAVNVKIVDYIDLTKFDISTLTPLSASHDYTAKITEGNKVEFSFDNIQLPFTAPESQGYVLFKIKTLDTLVLGDDFSNEAEVYFDFNFPIVTNLATTTVANVLTTPAVSSTKVELYPNPAKDSITLSNLEGFDRFTIYDTSGKSLINGDVNGLRSESVEIHSLKTGLYFVEILGKANSVTLKFIVQ